MAFYSVTSNTFANWTSAQDNLWLFAQDTHQGDGRSVLGIVIKTVFLAAATAIASLHLAQLRRQPTLLASYQIIATMLVPTFPLADFIISMYRTLKALRNAEKGNWSSYTICSALDVRASDDDGGETVPLHLVPPAKVTPVVLPYDSKWFVRLAIQLVFLLQTLYTIVLWMRRATFGTRAFFDDYMAFTALCGLTVTLLSLYITIMNTEWTCSKRYPAIFQQRFREAAPIDFLLTLEGPFEFRFASFIAIFFQSAAILSLKTAFAKEYYNKWQKACFEDPSLLRNDPLTLTLSKAGSLLFNISLRNCDSVSEWTLSSTPELIKQVFQVNANVVIVIGVLHSYYLVIRLAVFVISIACTWVGMPLGLKPQTEARTFRGWSVGYFSLAYCILIMAIWQLTNSDSSVVWSWKWKDPWAGVFWSFGT